jgi:hypothetical protein
MAVLAACNSSPEPPRPAREHRAVEGRPRALDEDAPERHAHDLHQDEEPVDARPEEVRRVRPDDERNTQKAEQDTDSADRGDPLLREERQRPQRGGDGDEALHEGRHARGDRLLADEQQAVPRHEEDPASQDGEEVPPCGRSPLVGPGDGVGEQDDRGDVVAERGEEYWRKGPEADADGREGEPPDDREEGEGRDGGEVPHVQWWPPGDLNLPVPGRAVALDNWTVQNENRSMPPVTPTTCPVT